MGRWAILLLVSINIHSWMSHANRQVSVIKLDVGTVSPISRLARASRVVDIRTTEDGGATGAVEWLSNAVLLTGNGSNTTLKLWRIDDGEREADCLQTLTLMGADLFNHIAVERSQMLVVLANAKAGLVYVLHLAQSADPFDYAAQFEVAQPILSLAALPAAGGVVQLCTIQTTAIQQYSLHPATCRPPDGSDFTGVKSVLLWTSLVWHCAPFI